MDWFIKGITVIVTVLVTLIWTVVVFLIWVPFLTRMMLVFIAAIMASVYTNKDPSQAKHGLEAAITFYSRGFQTIFQAMTNKLVPEHYVKEEIELRHALVEIGFAIIFW